MNNGVEFIETSWFDAGKSLENSNNYPIINNDIEVTVAVLAYNRIEKTKECVESILKYTIGNYYLFLVDNGSTDDTLKYFKSIKFENKCILSITKNIGAMYATNVLFKKIVTKYVALVMNDCIVTDNWLTNLMACMTSDSKIGLVCPMSSYISNNQELLLPQFSNEEELYQWIKDYNVSDSNLWEERMRVIPVVGVYRREVFDTVGVLDLEYKHEFSDDDYSIRLRRAGYKQVVCRDTFIIHNHAFAERKGNTTNENIATEVGKELFKKKYLQLEPWLDFTNFIAKYLPNLKSCTLNQKYILGIDVRCGTPILDMKNFYRKYGVREFWVEAITTDGKYFFDLQTISNQVKCMNDWKIQDMDFFDAIVLGEPLNLYNDYSNKLASLIYHLNENGILVFCINNSIDVIGLLNMFGIKTQNDRWGELSLTEKNILDILEKNGTEKVMVEYENYKYIPQEVLNFINSIVGSLSDEEIERLECQLRCRRVWFTVAKGGENGTVF